MLRNRTFIKRSMLPVLAAVMLFLSADHVFVAKADKTDVSKLEGQREEILEQIDDLKENIDKAKEEISKLKTEKTSIQNYITKLDQQTNALAAQISDFEEKIKQKAADIEQTEQEIVLAEEECDRQYESMKKRIQYMYENPTESLLGMLLTAEDMSDFLNRAIYVPSITDYDHEMMNRLIETKEDIEAYKVVLEAEKEDLQLMQSNLEAQKKKVDSSISTQKKDLAATEKNIDATSKEQDDYREELKEQEKLLDEIEEQIARAANGNAYSGEVTGFIWPCPSYTRISSYFGPRPQPVPGASTDHKGVDLAAPYGSAILASASGIVTTATYSNSAGNYVVISHGNGVSTVYMHASRLLVSAGETVVQGQKIAEVGSTGYSSGNHLHFGVIKNGTYVNPLGYVSP
ncbi:MAG: murein hydrolase activator EnvC family protein [Lachnospiraceae bacterium]